MAQLSSAGDPKRRAESSGIGRQSPDAPASAVTSPTFYDTSSPTGDPTVAAQETAASAPHTYTGARASPASGKHAAGREYAQALSKASQPRRRMPQWYERWFELPPTFEASLRRQSAFIRRALSPETVFEPLPAPLKQNFKRNFDFLKRSLTQVFNPQDAKQSLGLSNYTCFDMGLKAIAEEQIDQLLQTVREVCECKDDAIEADAIVGESAKTQLHAKCSRLLRQAQQMQQLATSVELPDKQGTRNSEEPTTGYCDPDRPGATTAALSKGTTSNHSADVNGPVPSTSTHFGRNRDDYMAEETQYTSGASNSRNQREDKQLYSIDGAIKRNVTGHEACTCHNDGSLKSLWPLLVLHAYIRYARFSVAQEAAAALTVHDREWRIALDTQRKEHSRREKQLQQQLHEAKEQHLHTDPSHVHRYVRPWTSDAPSMQHSDTLDADAYPEKSIMQHASREGVGVQKAEAERGELHPDVLKYRIQASRDADLLWQNYQRQLQSLSQYYSRRLPSSSSHSVEQKAASDQNNQASEKLATSRAQDSASHRALPASAPVTPREAQSTQSNRKRAATTSSAQFYSRSARASNVAPQATSVPSKPAVPVRSVDFRMPRSRGPAKPRQVAQGEEYAKGALIVDASAPDSGEKHHSLEEHLWKGMAGKMDELASSGTGLPPLVHGDVLDEH